MAYTNIKNIHFASNLQVDKILGTFTGTLTSPSPSASPETTLISVSTGIVDTVFFKGIYSIDGGTTWNDFENKNYDLPPSTFFAYLQIYGRFNVANGNMDIIANNYTFLTTPTAYTIIYKVALIGSPDTGAITPQPIGSNIYFNSNYNYQKIYLDHSESISISTSQTFTIAHNLGYIPKIRSFIKTSTNVVLETFNYLHDISIDEDNVYITLWGGISGINGTLYVRIYYDS